MTNSRTKKRLGLAVLCALTAVMTSGCSWLNTGEEEFSCSGMPGSIYC